MYISTAYVHTCLGICSYDFPFDFISIYLSTIVTTCVVRACVCVWVRTVILHARYRY